MAATKESSRTSKSALSRQRIIDAAVALADEGGIEVVTIRRVAKALGVTPMALYWHVRNKDELLALMADAVYGWMDVRLDPDVPWLDRARALLEAEVSILRAHPSLAPLVMSLGGMGEHAMAMIEQALGVLFEGGFSPTEAVQVMQHMERAAVSLVINQPAHKAAVDDDDDARQATAHSVLESLPEAQFPNMLRAAEPLTRCENQDQYYAFGMELLLVGIETMARERGTDR